MQEIISQIVARVQTIFSQLGDQVRAAMENAAAGKAILAALDVILPVASGVLRILAVFVAILIIVRCCRSIFREKPGKEIWGWLTLADGARLELCHWENAIGRGKWADVDLDFPTVSRSHAALLRDHKGNWTLQPLQTKNGTRVNGKKVTTTVPVQTGDVIDLGGVGMEFYAISEAEEREQAMRWGVAERPLSPGRTLGCLMVFQLMLAVQCLPGREKGEVAMIAVAFGILMAAMWFTYGIYRALKRTAFEAETIAFFLCSICFGITAAYSPIPAHPDHLPAAGHRRLPDPQRAAAGPEGHPVPPLAGGCADVLAAHLQRGLRLPHLRCQELDLHRPHRLPALGVCEDRLYLHRRGHAGPALCPAKSDLYRPLLRLLHGLSGPDE